MNILVYLILLFTFSTVAYAKTDLSLVPLFEPQGKYSIGFRTFSLDDPWHKNKLVLNAPDIPGQRRILVNVWYPTHDRSGPWIHSDYFQGVLPYEKVYLHAYDRFRRLILFQETFSQTGFAYRTPLPQNSLPPHPEAFQRSIVGKRNAEPAEGSFPIIFYHSGAQGGFEENAPLLEYFAQHGFVCVAVLGSSDDGGIDASQRSSELMWNDVSLAYEQLKKDKHADASRVALMGFSAGAQANLEFLMKHGLFKAAVLLDTTLENQDFTGFKSDILEQVRKYGSHIETPMLVLSEIEADYKKANRFRVYESITRAPRILVDFGKGVPHDDFTWHGLVQRSMQAQVDKAGFDKAMERYRFIARVSLKFLEEAFSADENWSSLEEDFRKSPSSFAFRSIEPRSRPITNFEDLGRMLQSNPDLLKTNLQSALSKKLIDPYDLSSLISHVRYTDSSLKALQICEALPMDAVRDELQCASIALENNQTKVAEKYVKAFYKQHKKPDKTANEWDRINYSDAKKLQDIIKAQTREKAGG